MPAFLTLRFFLTSCCCLALAAAGAQQRDGGKKPKLLPRSPYDTDTFVKAIPRQRESFHIRINHAQDDADYFDGKKDGMIYYGTDSLYTQALTTSLLREVDRLQYLVENLPISDPQKENQTKIYYLQAIWNFVTKFNADVKADPFFYKRAVANLRGLIIADYEQRLPEYVEEHKDKYSLFNSYLLDRTPDLKAAVYRQAGTDEPSLLIRRLKEYANEPFACDIIAAAARQIPNEVYSYASSTDPVLSGAIRRCQDKLVQTIVRIADQSRAPLKAMAFLSDIYSERKTIAQIDAITADQDLFFQNLVRLKLEGTAIGSDTYTSELEYRGLKYVRTMNELHEAQDPVRFRCIEKMTPAELYFIMVYGQNEIYTSSFIGTFNRMMQRRGSMSGDSLFAVVRYDKFRTFVRMCANFSKLSEFMGTMQPAARTDVMTQFMANLEQGPEDDLFDAVDVADAFASVTDTSLQLFLRQQVKDNYERVGQAKSRKGIIVYGLLSSLFESFATGKPVGEGLGLPPVNMVPYSALVNDSGMVCQQFFFYGDEDGKISYQNFLGNFKDGKWKQTTPNKQWTVFTSTGTSKPVTIYANLPVPEPEDEEAQKALEKYLHDQSISPTVVVHRGHSYHLGTTIDHINSQSRIVFLGSCGGYQNLGTVLDRSPDAQIISTKQTGTMLVNDAIVRAMNKRYVAGQDMDWVLLWAELSKDFAGKPGEVNFKEYVPPHRNLGAIFIKAYRRINMVDES